MKRTMEVKKKWTLILQTIFLVVMMSSIWAICPIRADAASPTGTAYSVTYDANGAVSGSVPVDSNTYAAADSVKVLPNTGGLVREGYSFGGWMTSSTIYQPGDTFSMGTGNIVMSAVWIPVYTVTYNGNNAAEGTVPVDAVQYPSGAYVTVLSSSGNLNQSLGLFKCWNTRANGSGTTYNPGDTFRMGSENITLYAIYSTQVVVIPIGSDSTVTYNGNGATSGFVPVDNTKNSSITVAGNTGSLLRTGYAFSGWNTEANGSGATYQSGNMVSLISSITLYAKWNPVYTITYKSNGGTANSYPYASGTKVKVLQDFTSTAAGEIFNGWNTKADGTGTTYMPDDVVRLDSNLTLYPIGILYDSSNPRTVIFKGNGNTDGSVPAMMTQLPDGKAITLPGKGTLKNGNDIFDGWFYDSNYYYKEGVTIQVWGSDVTLYAKWVPACSVIYDGNNASSGTVPMDSATYTTGVPVIVQGNTGGLQKGQDCFHNWNTRPDGSGITYYPGDIFTLSADTTLYAIYSNGVIVVPPSPPSLVTVGNVYYYSNRADGGTAPVDSTSYFAGSQVTVLGNTGGLSKNDYAFVGWNTRSDGGGKTYQPGNTFSLQENEDFVALFAVWNAVSSRLNVFYDGNGNTGGYVSSATMYDYVTVGDCGSLYRTGYTFAGWNTQPDGKGTTYQPGNSFPFPNAPNVTLYAMWNHDTTWYKVYYGADASHGSYSGVLPATNQYQAGDSVTVQPFNVTFPGLYFAGWNTKADGSGTTYQPGDTLTVSTKDVFLYAILVNKQPYFVFYNGNQSTCGSAPVNNQYYLAGQTLKVSYKNDLAWDSAHFFAGWNTKADGTGTMYQSGDTLTIDMGNVTLYAIWKAYPDCRTITYNGNGSTTGTAPAGSNTYAPGASVSLPENTGNLGKAGCVFYGWWLSGSIYTPGASFIMPHSPVTAYAVWESTTPDAGPYTVFYNGNGSTGGTVPFDSKNYVAGEGITLMDNIGMLTRTGYVFAGWSDLIQLYKPRQFTGSVQGNVNFYAVWLPAHTISYDGNGNTGGSVPVDNSDYAEGQTVTVLGNVNTMTKTSYLFDGWYINGRFYHPGDSLAFSASGITATAVWAASIDTHASLSDLKVDGTTVTSFAPTTLSYNVVLAANTTTVPAVTATATDAGKTNVVVTPATGLPGVTTVLVTAQNGTTTKTYTVNFTVLLPVIVTTASPNVNVSITPLQITVPSGVTDVALTTTPTVSGGNATVTIPQVSTTSSTSQGNVDVSIPNETQVTGPSTWDGTINLPKVVANNKVTVTPVSGYTASVSTAIEIGLSDTALTFNKPVRILITGQAGKHVGWVRNGVFTQITNIMSSDSAAALGVNNDGYLSIGSDLVIWTKHFTTFVAYTETAINSSSSGGGGAVVYTPSMQTTTSTTPNTPTTPVFSDVSASYWGYNAISSLSGKDIVSGYPDGTFKPDAPITRAEFATILVKALGLNTTGTNGKFTDVTSDAWYYGTVNAAASGSLVAGMGDNKFTPNALITREQMAVMVTKALGDKTPTTDGTELNAFSDKSAVSNWAKNGMAEATKAGIVNGMTADKLAPMVNANRAQAVLMIYKMLNILGK